MFTNRKRLYKKLEKMLNTKILTYATGDRPGFETQIGSDAVDIFIEQLDRIGITKSISLFLYTRGGDTSTAWNLINLLRLFCDELHIIVPHKAHSAGTLMCIGANSIIMTKQATLGPIDPSLNSPLNPIIPNTIRQYPVSVEAVKGYLSFAKDELGIKDDIALSNIMIKLSDTIHPLVLGQVYRTQAQIKMLAEKLLSSQVTDTGKKQQIISFLCSDSGSHDYTINRREAKDTLGLNVRKPSIEEYKISKDLYDDLAAELELHKVFNQEQIIDDGGLYSVKRVFIESIAGGCNSFITKGIIKAVEIPVQNASVPIVTPQRVIQNEKTFEGWEKL